MSNDFDDQNTNVEQPAVSNDNDQQQQAVVSSSLSSFPNRRLREITGRYQPPSFTPKLLPTAVSFQQPPLPTIDEQQQQQQQSNSNVFVEESATSSKDNDGEQIKTSKKKKTKKKRRRPLSCVKCTLLLQKLIQRLFGYYGYFVGRFPYVTLIIGLGVAFGCASGLMKIQLKPVTDNDFLDPDSSFFGDSNYIYYFSDPCSCRNMKFRTTTAAMTTTANNVTMMDYNVTKAIDYNETNMTTTAAARTTRRRRTTTRPLTTITSISNFTTISFSNETNQTMLINATTLINNESNLTINATKTTTKLTNVTTTTPSPAVTNRYACYNKDNFNVECRCRKFLFAFVAIGCTGRSFANLTTRCEKAQRNGFIYLYMFDRLLETESYIREKIAVGPNKDFNMKELCQRNQDRNYSSGCRDWTVSEVNTSTVRIPITINTLPFPYIENTKILSQVAGNVEIKEFADGNIYATSAKTIRSQYHVCYADRGENENLFNRYVEVLDAEMARQNKLRFEPNGITVKWHFNDRMITYGEGRLLSLIPKFLATIVAVAIWACVAMTASDSVTSKPWLGVIGILSTLLACAAGVGIMAYFGYAFSYSCAGVPFLILAIGLDDMFVVLTGQRHTSPNLPRSLRMKTTMFESGTAIFITALTNIVAEAVGSKTPFQIISDFTIYTLVLMTFDFFLQITIFASALSFFTMAEPKGRNSCCCCWHVPKRTEEMLLTRSACYIICCAANAKSMRNYEELEALHEQQHEEHHEHDDDEVSSSSSSSSESEEEEKEEEDEVETASESALKRLAHAYAVGLIKTPARYAAIVIYIGYVVFCVYGVLSIHYGMRNRNLAPYDSPEAGYLKVNDDAFGNFREVRVFIGKSDKIIDYWQPEVQQDMESMFRKLETSGYFHPSKNMTRWWLRDYLDYLKENDTLHDMAMADRDAFYDILYDNYVKDKNRKWLLDDDVVSCREDRSLICKTRGHVIAVDMNSNERQVAAWLLTQQIRQQYAKYNVFLFDDEYVQYEMKRNTVYISVYYILITVASAILVAILMVPNIILIFYITAMLLSEVMGLVGVNPYVGIDMDLISLTMLIINVGYSVDFVMHMSYDYMVAPGRNRNDKVVHALTDVGHALIPAASGTIMSVMAMATTGMYIYVVYFLSLAVAVAISALHAILFLPVFLSFFGPITHKMLKEQEKPKKKKINTDKSSQPPVNLPSAQTANLHRSSVEDVHDDDGATSPEMPRLMSTSHFDSAGIFATNVVFTPAGVASAHVDHDRRQARTNLVSPSRPNHQVAPPLPPPPLPLPSVITGAIPIAPQPDEPIDDSVFGGEQAAAGAFNRNNVRDTNVLLSVRRPTEVLEAERELMRLADEIAGRTRRAGAGGENHHHHSTADGQQQRRSAKQSRRSSRSPRRQQQQSDSIVRPRHPHSRRH